VNLIVPDGLTLETVETERNRRAAERDRTAMQESLAGFVGGAWKIVEPMTVFSPNWHIDAICHHLEAVSAGEIRRLLINIPPRHMKSLAVSVMWPAWAWTRKPHLRFLTASYGQGLAERDATKSRDLIRSPWYQARWPDVRLKGDVNRTARYENTSTGHRIATSVGGMATGEGGDVLILDDPHKAEEVTSDTYRTKVLTWHDAAWAHRWNDPTTGVSVTVMQRLHEKDLSGHVLESGEWTHLCLPARYERRHPFVWPDDPRTEEGELLWPDHMPEIELGKVEAQMTSFRAAGQLQQRPAAQEGEMLKRGWWRFYDPDLLDDGNEHLLPRFTHVVMSWDTSLKDRAKNDYVAGQAWGVYQADRYLLRLFHSRVNFQGTKTAIREMREWALRKWPGASHRVLIENAASGPDAIEQLKREIDGVVKVVAEGSKEQRVEAAAPALESGNILVPGARMPDMDVGYVAPAWVQELIEECSVFPNGQHDDQVDAWSQMTNWTRRHSSRGSATAPTGRIGL
jgi:predicted phage terminase large subunit-like protein